jgi:hypothetical protein
MKKKKKKKKKKKPGKVTLLKRYIPGSSYGNSSILPKSLLMR